MKETQIRDEFYQGFDLHHPVEQRFVVTFDEFLDYYGYVSAVIENDAYF